MARNDSQTDGDSNVVTFPEQPDLGSVPVEAAQVDGSNGTTPDGETPAKQTKPKTTAMIGVNVPLDMKAILDKTAEDAGKTPAAWLRDLLAQTINYTLPVKVGKTRSTNKYAGMSEADKAAAQKAENTQKRQTASALLAALEAGDLNVDLAEILSKYKPATRTAKVKESDAAPEATAAEAVS